MNTNKIYIGTIKKCRNVYLYEKHGEKRYIGDFSINNMECGYIDNIVEIITEEAILIKLGENKFVWINQIETLKDKLLVNLGITSKIITDSPVIDKDLFIDTKTLIPYFSKEEEQNISVGKLKKKVLIDPRLKLGIEN